MTDSTSGNWAGFYPPAEVPEAVVAPGYPLYILPRALNESPVRIQVPWNDDLLGPFGGTPGDRLQLLLDGILVGAPYEITEADVEAKQPLTLMLVLAPGDGLDWNNTPHTLSYEIRWSLGQGTSTGVDTTLYIDRTAPGGDSLKPVLLPTVGIEALVLNEQLDNEGRLLGHVPEYPDQWEGDKITPYIFGRHEGYLLLTGQTLQLPPGPVSQPIVIYYPESDLINAGNGVRLLGFQVVDLAGNVSAFSRGTPVILALFDPGYISDSA